VPELWTLGHGANDFSQHITKNKKMKTFVITPVQGEPQKIQADDYQISDDGSVIYFAIAKKPIGFFVMTNILSVFDEQH
jgi:hypothetical protein